MDRETAFARWLKNRQILPEPQLRHAWAAAQAQGIPFSHALLAAGVMSQDQIRQYFAQAAQEFSSGRHQAPPESQADGSVHTTSPRPTTNRYQSGVLTAASSAISPAVSPMLNQGMDKTLSSGELQALVNTDAEATVSSGEFRVVNGVVSAVDPTMGFSSSTDLTNSQRRALLSSQSSDLNLRSGEMNVALEDKYEIFQELSRGGMGVIKRARHKEMNIEVALKLMLTDLPNAEELERFQLEARALAQLGHPNVVRIRDYGWDNSRPYFAMDLVDGRDLKVRIDEFMRVNGCVPDFSWTIKVMRGVAEALAVCHLKGIMHRDLKPANILVESDTDRPVVIDFGLVKRGGQAKEGFESLAEDLTKTGQVLGTPAYMAPEQLDDKGKFGKVGAHSDVWGYGATLFYCLTGEAPYKGASVVNIFTSLLKGDPPRVRSINEDVPEWLDQLVASCLTRDARERPRMSDIVDQFTEKKTASPWPRRIAIGTSSLLLVCSLALALFIFLKPQLEGVAPKLSIVQPIPERSNEDKILVEVKVFDDFPERLQLEHFHGNERIKTYRVPTVKGLARVKVRLREGLNRFQLQAFDRAGNASEVTSSQCVRDSKAPRFVTVNYEKTARHINVDINGELTEKKCEVTALGHKGTIDGLKFSITVPLKENNNEFFLEVKDKAGNKGRKKISIRRVGTIVVVSTDTPPKEYKGLKHYQSLRAAIDGAPNRARVLILPGRYVGPFDLKRSLDLIGMGARRDIVITNDRMNTAFRVDAQSPVLLENLSFEGVTIGGGGGDLDKLGLIAASSSVTLKNCYITTKYCSGFFGKASYDRDREEKHKFVFDNCLVEKCQGQGLFIDNSRVEVRDTVIRHIGHVYKDVQKQPNRHHCGIKFENLVTARLNNVIIDDVDHVCLYVNQQCSVEMTDCTISRGSQRSGFGNNMIIAENNKVTMTNCVIKDSNFPGLLIRLQAQVDLNRCRFDNNSMGIFAEPGVRLTMRNSRISGSKHWGLIGQANSEFRLSDCIFRKNGIPRGEAEKQEPHRGGLHFSRISAFNDKDVKFYLEKVKNEFGTPKGCRVAMKNCIVENSGVYGLFVAGGSIVQITKSRIQSSGKMDVYCHEKSGSHVVDEYNQPFDKSRD